MSNAEKSYAGVSLAELFPIIEEKLRCEGEITFKPHGISMLPLLRQGTDSVTIGGLKEEPKRLDVIFYRRADGQFVLHRIIGKDSRGYILCGDNQCVREYGVTEEMIIGVMTAFYRGKRLVKDGNMLYMLYRRTLWVRRIYLRTKNLARRAVGKIKRILKPDK